MTNNIITSDNFDSRLPLIADNRISSIKELWPSGLRELRVGFPTLISRLKIHSRNNR